MLGSEKADKEPVSERVDEEMAEEELVASDIDRYKLIAVVDSARSLYQNECVYVNMKRNEITHLSVNTQTSLHFDELVSSYEQVYRIGRGLAHRFMTRQNSNKVVLNVAD